jgi:chitinase
LSKRFPGRRLSVLRLLFLVCVSGALVAVSVVGWTRFDDARAAATGKPFFAGYVDATATPFYAFEKPPTKQGRNIVLSFVVADPADDCEPSWGAAYSLDEAESALDLDRRIAHLARSGGEVSVSFGGLLNTELAASCTDVRKLTAAYAAVIDRYDITTIDLDIEGENLADTEAGKRRAEAVAALQEDRAKGGSPLSVWLTLPVAPSGLTAEGTDAVAQMLAAKVDLAGVNVMTMDYGASRTEGTSMLEASVAAARATHSQLGTLYGRAGIDLGPQTLWRKIGLTPMIGQNDVVGEVFDTEAAVDFNRFAKENGVGRMSMWSLNRDGNCSANYADLTVVSDGCSGIDQNGLQFAELLGDGFEGRASTLVKGPTVSEPITTPVADNPRTSPYPIWEEKATYTEDDRVVWHGNVYVAKYWTRGDVPDNPVLQAEETPWTILGPVLPGEKPLPQVTAPAGTYPAWNPKTVYLKGERILLGGDVFEAKWWTQGDSPEAAMQGSDGSPWNKLSSSELAELLKKDPGGVAGG